MAENAVSQRYLVENQRRQLIAISFKFGAVAYCWHSPAWLFLV
jgi:hypothetical protein